MKKKDILLAAGVCGTALLLWLAFRLFFPGEVCMVRITVDGTLYGEYSLMEDQEIAIGDTNVCRIQDGTVRMIQADCPDQLCIHQTPVDEQGGSIICLPNKVVIESVWESRESR